jgi:hypothetical protein
MEDCGVHYFTFPVIYRINIAKIGQLSEGRKNNETVNGESAKYK